MRLWAVTTVLLSILSSVGALAESSAAAGAAAPGLGPASLTVDQQIHLGEDSHLFKADEVFVWDDLAGNLSLGRSALSAMTFGSSNTAIGRSAMWFSYDGDFNTAVGKRALQFSIGSRNTGVGAYALAATRSDYNTAVGFFALSSTTDGGYNTAVGVRALGDSRYGEKNTAIGMEALRNSYAGYRNTATGYRALYSNKTIVPSYEEGDGNTASGYKALYSNETGDGNTAVGDRALFLNEAAANSAFGFQALYSNTLGEGNTASGDKALFGNTTGTRNTAVGQDALYSNTEGNRNIAIGEDALRSNTTGSDNIAIGRNGGFNLTTGDDNIVLGNPGVADEAATIRIGVEGTQVATFIAGISGAKISDAQVMIDVATGQLGVPPSSRLFKEGVRPVGGDSGRLLDLQPVAFRFLPQIDADGSLQFGLIAEEVAEVFPELVLRDDEGRPLTVRYHLLSSLLLNELQRQHRRVELLTWLVVTGLVACLAHLLPGLRRVLER